MNNLDKLKQVLEDAGINYQLEQVDPGHTDIDSTVKFLGIKYREGQATLIYKLRDRDFVAVLRRDDTLFDLKELKRALGTSRVSFATDEEIKELGFESGLVSPVMLNKTTIYDENPEAPKVKIYVEKALTEMEEVYTGSTSPEFALHIKKDDLLKLIGDYEVIDISVPNPNRRDEVIGNNSNSSPSGSAKVIVDDELINKFLNRAVENIFPTKEALEAKLKSGQRITAYMGFDPTGPYLHVGHAMGIRALRILQQLGHRVIFLVGDYTARVGDPDKASTRKLLTTEEIEKNMSGWKEQAGQLIDFEDPENPVEFLHNYDWLSKLDLEKIIELMSSATVQQMLERDLFRKRIQENTPIQLQEFIYPLMQGFDSVAMQVDLELGGTDQIFNMLVGRQLVEKYLHKEKFVRAHKMMPAPEGLTMSKTKGNGINLSDTAENMYGVAMSYPDENILQGLDYLTDTPDQELEEIKHAIESGENPMQYKKLMAFRVVEAIKGKQAAEKAQQHFESTIQNKEVSEQRVIISLEKMEARMQHLNKQGDAVTIISELMEGSKSQAKQLIQQGGIQVNGNKHTDENAKLELKPGDIVKVGKRNWFEIVD